MNNNYYKETFTPQSGIDTITIWIHPSIISNYCHFHEYGDNNKAINLRYKKEINYRTQKLIRTNFLVDIQAEALDPNNDIYDQILNILCFLAFNGTLHCPQKRDICDLANFYRINFDRLYALEKLDFYFDLRNDDMQLLGKPHPNYPNTRYSSVNPSVLKAYYRPERLRQKHNISYKDIDNMEYPARIEFSLCRENCKFLNMQNLAGTYENIFLRYLPFLARKWINYRREVVEVKERNIHYNHHLQQIIAVAGQRIPHYNFLLEAPIKPIPYKAAKKDEIDYNFISDFYSNI